MKIRKKFLYVGLVFPMLTIASVAVSCSETGTGTNNMMPVTNPDTKESLTTLARSITLDYENKSNLFTSDLSNQANRSKIKTTGLDLSYRFDIMTVMQDPGKGTVTVSFKIVSLANNVESDVVMYTISGFRSTPIVFDVQKKEVILNEINKFSSKFHINLQNFDVAVQKGDDPFNWENPETFEKIGVFNPDYYTVLGARFEEYQRLFNSPKPQPTIPGTTPATPPTTGGMGTETPMEPAPVEPIGVNDLPSQYFSFEMLRALWNKDQTALRNLLNSEFFKLIINPEANLTPAARALIAQLPFGINLTEVITKLVNDDNISIGFNQRSYFIRTGTKDINFLEEETFQEILRIPSNTPTSISGSDWRDFIPFFNVGGEVTPDLREIYVAFINKRINPVAIKRDGIDLTFSFFPPRMNPALVTTPPEPPFDPDDPVDDDDEPVPPIDQPDPTPMPPDPMPDPMPPTEMPSDPSPMDPMPVDPAPEPPTEMPPADQPEPPMPPVDPMIMSVTNQLQTFLQESLKGLKPTDILESTANIAEFGASLLEEIMKEMPNIKVNVQKREIKAGEKSIVFTNKIFDHVRVGLTHLFNTHGGNIQTLISVLQSKPNSADALFSDKAVLNFVEFIKPLATVESDWKDTLTKTLNRKEGYELKLDFDTFEISAKTSDDGTEYKKVVTFKKEFIEEMLKAITSAISSIFTVENATASMALNNVIRIVTTTVLKGVWIVKHSTTSGVEIRKMTTTPAMM